MLSKLDYYNSQGVDSLDESLLGSSPTGFVNFNRPKYKWSTQIYRHMQSNTWFPSEVDTSDEKKNYALLSENEQEIYKLTFAQLSFNDSAQEQYLSDFKTQTSNRLVRSALTLQTAQEANHSESYAVLLDACGNSEEVFELYKTNDALNTKNEAISEHFAKYINGRNTENIFLSSMASINLEGIYFLLGFSYIYVLGDKVPGARDMIKFIARDELATHAPLFVNIFKTIERENKIATSTYDKVYEMIKEAVEIELRYGEYLFEHYPIMGLSKELIESTVYNFANRRLEALGLLKIFPSTKTTYLEQLVSKHLAMNDVKTNFFEGNVSNYSKGSISMDF
jgi:ribonucleoside-diphosphate reductase beta chain